MSKKESKLESTNTEELSQEDLDQVTGGWMGDGWGDGTIKQPPQEDSTNMKELGDVVLIKTTGDIQLKK